LPSFDFFSTTNPNENLFSKEQKKITVNFSRVLKARTIKGFARAQKFR
jgi:hypothetical protein